MTANVIRLDDKPMATWREGKLSRLHASASCGNTAQLCINESWNDPGVGAPTHSHPDGLEEIIMVLEGDAEFWVDGDRTVLHAGDCIILPPYSHHGFSNVGTGKLHVIAAFGAAAPKVIFDSKPDEVVVIGGTVGTKLDDTRVVEDAS